MPQRESESSPGPLEGEGTGGTHPQSHWKCPDVLPARWWCGGGGLCRASRGDVCAAGQLRVDIPLEIVSVGPAVAIRIIPRASGEEGDGSVARCGAMLSVSHMVDSGRGRTGSGDLVD